MLYPWLVEPQISSMPKKFQVSFFFESEAARGQFEDVRKPCVGFSVLGLLCFDGLPVFGAARGRSWASQGPLHGQSPAMK